MTSGHRLSIRMTRQQSRAKIIESVTELIRHRSYAELTVDEVMRDVGANRTIFYRHFDDLADLMRQAGREAFERLYQAEEDFRAAHVAGDRDLVRAAIRPAVAVYREHGPLLRAISEAAATGDEVMAGGQAAMLERFDALVFDVLQKTPRLRGRPTLDIVEIARALNLMNVNYLLDVFGREPRATAAEATRALTEIWSAVIG